MESMPTTPADLRPGPGVSGWQRKHEMIASAALALFSRDGYERTSVDAIAAEAGVSKRTIYNRYGDKENLFLSVLWDTYNAMMTTFRAIARLRLSLTPRVASTMRSCTS